MAWLAGAFLAVSSAEADVETKIIGDKGTAWPAHWTEITALRDGADAGTAPRLDFTTNALGQGTVYWAKDEYYVYFRLRLNIATVDVNTYRDVIWIYINKVGYGSAVADYAIAWDSKSDDNAKHGVEMQVYYRGTTWSTIEFDDIDGTAGSKLANDINGGSRTTDGYLRILSNLSGVDTNTSFIDWAVSWTYLETYTDLRKTDVWYMTVGCKNSSTDHNTLGTYPASDLTGLTNFNSVAVTEGGPGWNGPMSMTTPTISGVISQTQTYGDTSVTLSGVVSAGSIYPANGETVSITINGVTTNATIAGGAGAFSVNFSTATTPYSATPYPITYVYPGSGNLAPATNSSTTLTVNKAALNITASSANKTYGKTYTAVGSGQTAFSTTGLKNGETVGSVTITATSGPPDGTQPTDPVGAYTLTPSAATGGTFSAANYTITYTAGTLSVIPPALKITAATATPNGGSPDALTLYLVDESGATVTSLSGDYHLTFSGLSNAGDGAQPTVTDKNGVAVALGTTTTITFASGISSSGGTLVAYKAEGPVTLHATDGATASTSTGGAGASLTIANASPTAGSPSYERNRNAAWRIPIITLLTNATDANRDVLTLTAVSSPTPSGATIQMNATHVLYTPPTSGAETNATGTFTYTVSDGITTGQGTVTLTIATDPTVTNHNFVAYGMVGSDFVMTFAGVPGYTYEIQYTDTLPSASWTTLWTTNAPATGIFSVTNPPAPGPSRFYRALNR